MSPYVSNIDLSGIAERLKAAKRIVLTTHAKPDGDAVGAVVAVARALERLSKAAEMWFMPPVPESLIEVIGVADGWHRVGEGSGELPAGEPDAIVIVDTGSWTQLQAMRCWLEPRTERVIVIDHHLSGDDVWAYRYVDSRAASTCEIVCALIDVLGVAIDRAIADPLYIGVATDTGWFRFSNTTPATHRTAARLLESGVDHAAIYQAIEHCDSPEKVTLMARALNSMELLADGRAALMSLANADFAATGAGHHETERFVDVAQRIGTVRLVALVCQTPEGVTRISFRSKPGPDAVNVSELAQRFGGGGHARAAGAKVGEAFETVRKNLRAAMVAAFA